jgi:hypothetical protein
LHARRLRIHDLRLDVDIDIPMRPVLERDIGADVCIVGRRDRGALHAYFLLERGRGAVVLDDGPIGGGETCRTSAHLS